jgi:hypothetical protein
MKQRARSRNGQTYNHPEQTGRKRRGTAMFYFWISTGKIKIRCELEFAAWLVNTGRVVCGVYEGPCFTVYL